MPRVTRRGAKRPGGGYAGLATVAVLGAAFGASPAVAQQSSVNSQAAAAMAATVHELRGCVHAMSATDRFLLALRFGIGGRPQKSDPEVAARLHTTSAIVAAREVIAVRRLADAHRRGACNGGHVTASAASSSVPAVALSPLGATGGSRGSGSGISFDALLAGAVILAALVVAGREFRKAIFGPPPPR
jgi:hypothetical protein